MEYSNAEKLAAVVSEWTRPAISQVVSGKLMHFPAMRSLQATIAGSGLVGRDYQLTNDIEPLVQPVVDALVQPMVRGYLKGIPDEAIPAMANAVVQEWRKQGSVTMLDGLVTFEPHDIDELERLLRMNLPLEECEMYEVIH